MSSNLSSLASQRFEGKKLRAGNLSNVWLWFVLKSQCFALQLSEHAGLSHLAQPYSFGDSTSTSATYLCSSNLISFDRYFVEAV